MRPETEEKIEVGLQLTVIGSIALGTAALFGYMVYEIISPFL